MLSLALAALRSRRAQSLAFMLLTCLVIGGVAGTPYYLLAAANGVVERDQFNVPPEQTQVVLSEQVDANGTDLGIAQGVEDSLNAMNNLMKLDGTQRASVVGSLQPLSSANSPNHLNAAVAYADGVCDHVKVDGACPSGANETMISAEDAVKLRLNVGDKLPFAGSPVKPTPQFEVVGIYTPKDMLEPYWGGFLLAANQATGSATTGDAAFVSLDTVKKTSPQAYVTQTISLPVGHLSQLQVRNIDSAIAEAQYVGPRHGIAVQSGFANIVDHINQDVNKLLLTVPVLAAETIFLGWFALFLVVRANAANRRAETGLLRLRGVPRRTQWGQSAFQTFLPALIAAPLGAVLGILGAYALAGRVPADQKMLARSIAAGVSVIVILGVYVAAATASRRGRSGPILEMLRDTPPRRRGWRSDAADVIVLLLAIAAIYQSHQTGAQGGLVLVAPALAALAIALVVARLIAPIAARMVPRMTRSGNVGGLLTATHLARRPGIDRIFTLLVVVVSLVANALLNWSVATRAQTDRAHQEVGAPSVLLVNRTTPDQLIALTRKVDPSGRYAMAVSEHADGDLTILAVDSSRLGAVFPGGLPGTPGVTGAELARVLHPAAVRGLEISGTDLAMTVDAKSVLSKDSGSGLNFLMAKMASPAGDIIAAPVGPLQPGRHEYHVPVSGCTPSCNLLSLYLSQARPTAPDIALSASAALPGTEVVLNAINGHSAGPAVSWRTMLNPNAIGPMLTDTVGGLDISMPHEHYQSGLVDAHAYPATTPVPLPVALAGSAPRGPLAGIATAETYGDTVMPYAYVTTLSTVPRVGRSGAVVDMEYANYVNSGGPSLASMQVWLAAGTPDRIVSALKTAGLTVTGRQTVAGAVAGYRSDSSAAARRYELLGSALGLMLGVIALLLVGAGERRARATELAALRVQGVPHRFTRRAIGASYTLLAAGAVVVGLLAALGGRAVTGGHTNVFTDGWQLLPTPSSWSAIGWLLVLIATAVPIMATAVLVSQSLRRDVSRRLKVAKQ